MASPDGGDPIMGDVRSVARFAMANALINQVHGADRQPNLDVLGRKLSLVLNDSITGPSQLYRYAMLSPGRWRVNWSLRLPVVLFKHTLTDHLGQKRVIMHQEMGKLPGWREEFMLFDRGHRLSDHEAALFYVLRYGYILENVLEGSEADFQADIVLAKMTFAEGIAKFNK